MERSKIPLYFLVLILTMPFGALAAESGEHHQPDATTPDNAGSLAPGEVKKVDKDAGKVTIKHGPLDNLGMPAMTMVFRVKDPAMLDQLKAGDTINFLADKWNGALTIMRFEVAK